MTIAQEEFVTIPAYPNYEVSTLGNVRRKGSTSNLSPIDNGKGYKTVHLSNGGKRRLCLIHRVVISTFDPQEGTYDVNHKNGNKADNSLVNLEWVTKSENTRHAHLTGLFSSRNKLTIEQVKEIKAIVKQEERNTYEQIGQKYNVRGSIISKIARGHLYGYVGDV